MAKSFVEWLEEAETDEGQVATAALDCMANGAKTLLLKLARRKPFDYLSEVERLGAEWDRCMTALERLATAACFEVA